MNQAQHKITIARTALILDEPFFGALALRLELKEDKSISTLATDGKYMFFNPDFVLSLRDAIVKSAVAHEVMHCVLDHIQRRGGRSPERWNHAADYAANLILKDSSFVIPPTWLLDEKYRGLSVNEIYNLLTKPESNGGESVGEGGSDLIDPKYTEAEAAEMEDEWKVATVQAAAAAKVAGKLPGNLERFINEALKPKVDWKEVLRRFVKNTTAAQDFTFSRPNRFMMHTGVCMPSLHSEQMGEIVIGLDMSGSVGQSELDAFAGEIHGIVGDTMPEKIHLVYCDSSISHVDVVERYDPLNIKAHGGGGTAFKPVFDYVEQNNISPACLIYLTDLYGDTNFPEPPYPTLWCCVSPEIAPWGETIKLDV